MSFATRCNVCGTLFRVVQDQLKVSDGWVRCGRCDAVFDAASSLFDLEREAPPDWRPMPSSIPAAEPETGPVEPVEAAAAADGGTVQSEDERRWSASMAAQGFAPDDGDAEAAGTPPAVEQPQLSSEQPPMAESPNAEPRFEPVTEATPAYQAQHVEDDDAIVITDHASGLRVATSAAEPLDAVGLAEPSEADAPPGFLRPAARQGRWQSGRARAGLSLLVVLLMLTLALQAAQQHSELAAARWPALRPALTAWCGLAGCSVGPPHRIDDIVVENTALSPVSAASAASGPAAPGGAASAPPALRLAVTLRNRAGYAVALPSIDLSLTDISGKLIARRALSPADFQVAATAVPAAAELPLQAVLTTMATSAGVPAPVSGYTVEIFYP